MDKHLKETHFVIRTSQKFKDEFKEYCDECGFTMTKRIMSLIKKDMKSRELEK